MSAALLLVVVLALAGSYGMNVWYRVIFDALQSRESSTVLSLSLLYLPLLAGSVLVSVMQLRLRMSMQRRWRAWLNHRLLDRWLRDGRYYQLDLIGGPHRNPEGRIADDARIATDAPVELAIGLTTAVLSAATFIAVLWTVGGAVTVEIASAAVTVPGFLVVAAAVYAALDDIRPSAGQTRPAFPPSDIRNPRQQPSPIVLIATIRLQHRQVRRHAVRF